MEVIILIVLSLLSILVSIGVFILNELVNDIRDLRTEIDFVQRLLRKYKND